MTHGNILVLTQWSFRDALVQTYTLPYVEIIRKIIPAENKIIVVTSEQKPIDLKANEINHINSEWEKKNMQLFAESYERFGLKKLFKATARIYKLYRLIKKEKIKTIHAFCTPAGGIAYLLHKFTGTRLVIDSYEPHAEAMVENGTWKKNSLAYKILFALEKRQTKFATALIATSEGMKQYALDKYGARVSGFFVKPACVDMMKFFPRERDPDIVKELNLLNKKVCVYAGKLGGIYYKEEVFDFIKACYDHWNEDFRFVMLTNSFREEIETQLKRVGLPGHVVISRFVFHNDIPRYLSLGDFAINPVKPVPTKRYCTSIKDGEYWAMGLPVVISPGISDDSDIIMTEQIGLVVNMGDKTQLLNAVLKLDEFLETNSKDGIRSHIRDVAKNKRDFSIAEKIYQRIYN